MSDPRYDWVLPLEEGQGEYVAITDMDTGETEFFPVVRDIRPEVAG